ncbi:methyl-accepting chemotaxis sensory transducer [Paenibacillus curdlanolyticus YK9]|uniref:Methyl-accepting chemotaxis sensory transducer n=1 Tax=Paenibacillus curdlanolyticus YK9 TaxID=717606 RepID=E0IDF9_9BACL|nr:methyl-accepting chemotaxis protein [Paenibacillus curdlanolyticus]EFM09614.1 methyl-accepting chemotaxis sensory transducer [Paenibacillus curdlanolyticus YK9]
MLKPFLYVMNRLKYSQKFVLIALLFLIPTGFMSYFLTSEIQITMDVAKKEQQGVAYLKPLKELLLTVQKHRGVANAYLNGDSGKKAELEKLEAQWKQEVEAVHASDALYGKAFGIESQWSGLETRLSMLLEQYAAGAAGVSFAKHTTMIEELLDFNVVVSDASGLTLDPEQHTYYLMDMLVQRTPLLMEKIAQTRGQITGTLLRGKLTPSEKLEYRIDYDRIETAMVGLQKDWASTTSSSPDIQSMQASYTAASTAARDYVSLLDTEILNGRLSMDSDTFFAKGTAAIDQISVLYNETAIMMDRQLQLRIDDSQAQLIRMLALTVVALLLVVAFFIAFYSNVRNTIAALEKAASRLAAGDASARAELQTRDELSGVGVAFNQVAETFANLLRSNQTVAGQLAASSEDMESAANATTLATNQIAHAVQELTMMAEQQAAVSEQNATAMHEMAEGISRIAETAGSVSDNADQASAGANAGRRAVTAATEQMAVVRKRSSETSDALSKLGELSGRIGDIAAVMTDIAGQTHLLSLNANIEAARAGEHGKGFAVVAQEVQKLSEQSRQSADEIGGLIAEATEGIERAVAATSGSTEETARGMASMEQVNVVFDGILESIGQVAAQISEVSAASEQLSAATEEVAAAVQETSNHSRVTSEKTQEVSASTEEQLASMEEVLASSEALNATAGRLRKELSRFTF